MVSAEVVFLGTGTSEGVPRVSCLTRNPIVCRVCQSSMKHGSKNRRRNTSLAIQFQEPQGDAFNIIVDVGKFFWHSAIEWFPKYGINTIDAVVLTHSHADAAGGLDDLRDWTNNVQNTIPVYLRPQDLDVVARTHFYLVNDGEQTGGGGVSKLEFRTIGDSPFKIGGLTFIPLPVMHGDSYTAHGYRFGDFSYISDASAIPDSTADLITGSDILVMDALRPNRQHRSHFTLDEAIEQASLFKARKTLFVDMTHDIDHESVNTRLSNYQQSHGLDIQLAYDGLRIKTQLPIDLRASSETKT